MTPPTGAGRETQLELLGRELPPEFEGLRSHAVFASDRAFTVSLREQEAVCAAAIERNQWVLSRLEEWRKADHAASQQRCEGRKHRRQAETFEGSGMFADEATAQEKAEACFVLAGQHEARANAILAQLTARVR